MKTVTTLYDKYLGNLSIHGWRDPQNPQLAQIFMEDKIYIPLHPRERGCQSVMSSISEFCYNSALNKTVLNQYNTGDQKKQSYCQHIKSK